MSRRRRSQDVGREATAAAVASLNMARKCRPGRGVAPVDASGTSDRRSPRVPTGFDQDCSASAEQQPGGKTQRRLSAGSVAEAGGNRGGRSLGVVYIVTER